MKIKKSISRILISAVVVFMNYAPVSASVTLDKLMVEYTTTPIGIDVKKPRFSWQMVAPEGERDIYQSAYQVEVKDDKGNIVWNSGEVRDGGSLGIIYNGSQLMAATRYSWTVTVWDQEGATSSAASWFETGLLDPGPGAWNGAQWIGGGSEDLVLYAPYLVVFDLEYKVAIEKESTRAGFIFGANDSRLMDKYKNIYQIQNGKNESYIKVELDISGMNEDKESTAKLNIYRVGYTPSDDPGNPFRSFDIKTEFINNNNKHDAHTIKLSSVFGQVSLSLDGNAAFINDPEEAQIQSAPAEVRSEVRRRMGGGSSVNLNPMGSGGNYLPFGMLCEIGFSVEAGQKATFSDVMVYNKRLPNNILFSENLSEPAHESIYATFASDPVLGLTIAQGKYLIDGGTTGSFIVANPSKNSTPMLRTEFKAHGRLRMVP